MGSPLDFVSSEGFRKSLIIKNLPPYAKSPNRQSPPTNYEYIQSNLSVIDSPDGLIDEPTFANKLYPLNEWGAEGGYKDVSGVGDILPRKSNQGEYGPGQQDAKILGQALPESKNWKKINPYSDGSQSVLDGAEFISTLEYPEFGTGLFNNQPYFTFVPSSYSPLSILLNPDPQGDNGLLSQDSYIVKLGAQTLKREFQERIAAQIRQDTIGRANVFSVDSATDILNIINGRVPLIEPNWTITAPENPVLAATNFILRLGGSILPVSPIPGSYFDENTTQRQPTTIQQLSNAFRQSAVGNFFRTLLGTNLSGSEIFYNNTGQGQKSVLFKNINYNKYKPSFDRTLLNRVGGALVGSTTDNSNFYIGSNTSDPSKVFSPPGELPVNEYGQEQQSPVYGPSELSQLYEGPSKEIRLGANGPTYSNGGGIEGGLTWVSPKYKGNAGKRVGIGGEVTNEDEDFKPSSYNSTESTNIQFRQGSILDDTQRLVDSQPQGGRRLQHVGNAIDQVSKVFNDGYKELTKGSRVLSYVGAIGQEVGSEYCRVFSKDIPYLQYNDLQKTDGITTEGRRFSWSVLDKAYNLNISPNKQEGGQSSTNLINAPGGLSTNVGYAKKYMFSLENLAWRTSSTPGYTVSDLPICERGPNGGRVMWFPPYGLTFTENTNSGWKENDFLGRPEPIYTYINTRRTGSLSWKIVVDHPSSLNVIVNKVLNNETNKTRIDSILDSFFAGCRKYDLYELAKKYNTIPPNDLYQIQQAINNKEVTRKQLEFIKKEIQTGVDSTGNQDQTVASNPEAGLFQDYVNNLSFYFGNAYPYQDNQNYQLEYNRYTSSTNKEVYKKRSPSTAEQTSSFFEFAVQPNYEKSKEFIKAVIQNLKEYPDGNITIIIGSSCSAPASETYNLELSKRRINSVITYLKSSELSEFIDKRVFLKTGTVSGENASVKKFNPQTKKFEDTSTVSCTDTGAKGGDTTVGADEIFTVNAMACRRAYVEKIEQTLTKPVPEPQKTNPQPQEVLVGNVVEKTVIEPQIEEKLVAKDNITKRVLRHLLSECDYFETIKEETPMVFDNLKDKLKFFQPAFHSMTPEGLNSRLTFLQQCMRPGDTIPTIKQVDGNTPVLEYNDAYNTAFGTPPVLVLRVGDFYNTKIIPDALSLTYENLDFNPEGIGVQPMIANVTLSFKFVGGSGLKNSIDKIQNALTFNFYANTEIYDERADVTDESYQVIDKEFLDSISPDPPTLNQSQPNNGKSNQNTIGNILTKEIGDFETGTISYSDIMETLKTETQNYFTTLVNKSKEITSQYNNAVRQQWMLNRNYTRGKFSLDSLNIVELFGKPSQFQKNIDGVFKKFVEDIKNDNDPYLQFISNKNFSEKLTRQAKENYINLVKGKKNTFENGVTTITQEVVNMQQNYINLLGKINTITYIPSPGTQGTDGFQQSNGMSVIYCISGTPDVNMSSSGVTNTLNELEQDVRKVRRNIVNFSRVTRETHTYTNKDQSYSGVLLSEVNDIGNPVGSMIIDSTTVFNQFSKNVQFNNENFKRMYMILSDVILDDKKYETFKNSMIGNIISNPDLIGKGRTNLEEVFDTYWLKTAKPAFLEENEITIGFIDDMEKTKLKDYLKYTPYEKKDRVLTFTSENTFTGSVQESQKRLIIGLGSNLNISSDTNTWNNTPEGSTADVVVSKAKLN